MKSTMRDVPVEACAWTSYDIFQICLCIDHMTAVYSGFLSEHSTPRKVQSIKIPGTKHATTYGKHEIQYKKKQL